MNIRMPAVAFTVVIFVVAICGEIVRFFITAITNSKHPAQKVEHNKSLSLLC